MDLTSPTILIMLSFPLMAMIGMLMMSWIERSLAAVGRPAQPAAAPDPAPASSGRADQDEPATRPDRTETWIERPEDLIERPEARIERPEDRLGRLETRIEPQDEERPQRLVLVDR